MAPGSPFYYITSRFHYIASCLLFCNLYFPIYTTKIPKIFTLLSLLDLIFAIGCEGIDNPFIALVGRFLIVCAGTRWLVCCLLLDWYLGSQTEENTYLYFAAHPFLFKEKTNASSRGSWKNFWHRCRGDLRQVKPYQVPIISSSPSDLHYFPFASRFPLPHFTLAVLFALSLCILPLFLYLPLFALCTFCRYVWNWGGYHWKSWGKTWILFFGSWN